MGLALSQLFNRSERNRQLELPFEFEPVGRGPSALSSALLWIAGLCVLGLCGFAVWLAWPLVFQRSATPLPSRPITFKPADPDRSPQASVNADVADSAAKSLQELDAPSLPGGQSNVHESQLLLALTALREGRSNDAEKILDELIVSAPNFRLAHLLKGDLLQAKTRPIVRLGDTQSLGYVTPSADPGKAPTLFSPPAPAEMLTGLRQEAHARWAHAQTPLPDLVPAEFARLASDQTSAVALDVSRSRLYLFSHENGKLKLISHHYATVGKTGGGKLREGDQRTPVGLYTLQGTLARDKLAEFYGAGAVPLDYPNEWDRMQQRTGHGIWLHGTPASMYARAPRASDGCVVVSNDDWTDIQKRIKPGRTPILIAEKLDWQSAPQANAHSESIATALETWRRDWESLDLTKYFNHYSPRLQSEQGNFGSWAEHKRSVQSQKTWVKVGLKNLSLLRYPGVNELWVATFEQDYQSNNLSSQSRKRQYWQREGGNWKIIYEGNA